ncbi:MAG: hypothetical protein K9L22_00390 [Methylococcaceae bacterium]|nr:hypothetical protein [Methylococcaceae bacterium]
MIRRFDLWLIRSSGLSLSDLNNSSRKIILPIAMRALSVLLLFFALACAGYLSTFSLLKVEMLSDINSEMQVYWANENSDFSEQYSQKEPVFLERKTYWFWINDFNKSTRFRIDPVTEPAHLKIKSVQLYSLHYYPINFDFLYNILRTNDITSGIVQHDLDFYIEYQAIGDDPSIEVGLILTRNPWVLLCWVIFIFSVVFFKKVTVPILFFFVSLILIYIFISIDNRTDISFHTQVKSPNQHIDIFWRHTKDEKYSYTRAKTVPLVLHQDEYTVSVPNIKNIEVLFLDDKTPDTPLNIENITLKEHGFNDILIEEKESAPVKQVNTFNLTEPFIFFLLIYLFYFLFILFITKRQYFLYIKLQPIFILFFFILATTLIFNLAWQADYNIHPDENAHIESVHYYSHYWLPPTVGDANAVLSYQMPWAISRLDDLGISYFFAGKFENIVQFFFTNTTFSARAFNALLFILLFSYSRQKRLVLFMAPLLCTPQIWYLYSYANRDAFALFISLLLAWQLVNVKSALNNFLQSTRVFDNWHYVLIPGILLGILSIEQTNYYLFILFFLAFLLWRVLFFVQAKRVFIYKCLMLMCVALLVFVARYGLDTAINGSDKYSQRTAYAEQHAGAAFKPSIASTTESYSGLRLKDKGISLSELFAPQWDWHKMTFKSFTGFYGYYAEYSPRWYYIYVLLVYGVLLLLALRHALLIAEWRYQLFSVLTGVALVGGLLMGILFSWLYDFQPQGRYIFPIIPIILVYFWVMAPFWTPLERAAIMASALILMILSFYSFNEVALNYLFA